MLTFNIACLLEYKISLPRFDQTHLNQIIWFVEKVHLLFAWSCVTWNQATVSSYCNRFDKNHKKWTRKIRNFLSKSFWSFFVSKTLPPWEFSWNSITLEWKLSYQYCLASQELQLSIKVSLRPRMVRSLKYFNIHRSSKHRKWQNFNSNIAPEK